MAAPNLKEIEWAIAELEREESSFPVYAKLANLYTVRNEMLGLTTPSAQPQIAAYSEAAPVQADVLGEYGGSEFLRTVAGKDPAAVWAVMDEFMDTLRVVNARAYDGVMRKMQRI